MACGSRWLAWFLFLPVLSSTPHAVLSVVSRRLAAILSFLPLNGTVQYRTPAGRGFKELRACLLASRACAAFLPPRFGTLVEVVSADRSTHHSPFFSSCLTDYLPHLSSSMGPIDHRPRLFMAAPTCPSMRPSWCLARAQGTPLSSRFSSWRELGMTRRNPSVRAIGRIMPADCCLVVQYWFLYLV